tara:strand:+ start:626 stop:1213 length:588 start_codon:yes stop_codon:yes gene_type:complete
MGDCGRKTMEVEITTLRPPRSDIHKLRDTSKTRLPRAKQARTTTGFHDTHIGYIHHDDYGFVKFEKKTDGRCFVDNMKKFIELTQKYGVGKFHLYLQKVWSNKFVEPLIHIAIVVIQDRVARYIDVSNGRVEIYNFSMKLAGFSENANIINWGLMDLSEEILDLFKEKRSVIDYEKLCFRVSNACYTNWTYEHGY